MRLPHRMLAAALLAAACSMTAAAQADKGAVRVEISDSSGGRLPGVSVVATSADGHILTGVTDRTGGYVFSAVPTGPVMLRFRLEGFAGALVGVTIQPGVETRVVQRLELAPLAETVDVQAATPVEPPRPLPPPPVPSPSRGPLVKPIPTHDRDSVCGPAKPNPAVESLGTIRSTRYVAEGGRYTTGGQIAVDGGALNGLEVGQNLVVRHYFRVPQVAGAGPTAEHSAGLVQIVSVRPRSATAVAIYACDELRTGDFLAAFRPEPVRPPEPRGLPDYNDAARILFADEGHLFGVPGQMMVIDRGSERGIRVGQRLTLFRRRDFTSPTIVGDAIVVATRTDSATIRVERVSDMVSSGDLAATQIPELAMNR